MKFKLILGDITQQTTDAIVNPANKTLLGGGGVDGAIHREAGLKLLEECKLLGGCKTGEAKITKGYNLKAKYVIHTAGPIYNIEKGQEKKLLTNCYYNSLNLAVSNGIKTISFPSISTGAFRYPKKEACEIAIKTCKDFDKENPNLIEIVFVVFDKESYDLYNKELLI